MSAQTYASRGAIENISVVTQNQVGHVVEALLDRTIEQLTLLGEHDAVLGGVQQQRGDLEVIDLARKVDRRVAVVVLHERITSLFEQELDALETAPESSSMERCSAHL